MKVIMRGLAIFVVALKRLLSQPGLALATAAGLIAAIALTMSVPLYADAVYYRMLRTGLFDLPEDQATSKNRPPFAFMFRYVGSWYEPLEQEEVARLDQFLSEPGGVDLGLPREQLVRHIKTDNFRLFPQDQVQYADVREPLAWVSFGFVSNIEDHIEVIEGSFPAPAEADVNSPIPVLISEARATELGLQVGESFTTFAPKTENNKGNIQIPVTVAGIWRAKDPSEDFWFYEPSALEDLLIIPEATYMQRIAPIIEDEVYVAVWYLLLDGANVHAKDAGPLLRKIQVAQQQVSALLPNTALAISPQAPLEAYQRSSRVLTILLYAFSVPIIGLLLAFIILVVGLTVGRQRNEIAVLRSRGATAFQVVSIAAVEALILGTVALLLATPLSEWIARTIGRTTSFLNFTALSDLRVQTTSATLRYGFLAVGLALVAQLLPTIGASRHTIVTYKQERARSLKRPWWQRTFLDIVLLAIAGYGWYVLNKQGSVVVPGAEGAVAADPFANPLLFLLPALMVFALTLFLIRLLPLVMSLFGWIAGQFGSVGTMLAARQLARTPGFYSGPLLLLTLTLSLSAYTASLAETLDRHLYHQSYYKIGSDMHVVELGEDTEQSGGAFNITIGEGNAAGGEAAEEEDLGPRWNFLPITEYLKVDGVQGAARVGTYPATSRLSGGSQRGTFMGVDRVDFASVASRSWRSDYAYQRLGALMNNLATTPEGVLVYRPFMAQHALKVGDTIRIDVDTYGKRNEMDMKVVGSFEYWPTWYPGDEDSPNLFVGNLEHLYEQAGDQYPYDVWLKTDPDLDPEAMVEQVRELNLNVLDYDVALERVNKEQKRPERQGLFGFLSIGFAAAALLTVLGFFLYALFSFRRRFIELGILRAIGLSSGQMTSFLAWELAFLILTGLVVGTLLGVLVSQLFIPALQVGAGVEAQIPPYQVQIAWPAIFRIWMLFAVMFVVALVVLAALLMRMRIFQAVKLGETA
jgi:putative ABC transport system permease protein